MCAEDKLLLSRAFLFQYSGVGSHGRLYRWGRFKVDGLDLCVGAGRQQRPAQSRGLETTYPRLQHIWECSWGRWMLHAGAMDAGWMACSCSSCHE